MKQLSLMVALTTLVFSSFVSARQVTDNRSNPAIGLILSGTYGQFSQDPQEYAITGFELAGESGPGEAGMGLGESELNISSQIDHLFYGHITTAFAPEGELEVEESYIQTTSLGQGLSLKAGRFFSGMGYLNSRHPHSMNFVDTALAYRALLGGRYADDGVQFSWLLPTRFYMQLQVEQMRGEGYPAAGAAAEGQGAHTLGLRFGGDVGSSHSWGFGLSSLAAKVDAREGAAGSFSGDTQVNIIDLVWKWAPNGNPRQQNLSFQSEYLNREEQGEVDDGVAITAYKGRQNGWYSALVYQFMPRWRAGVRYDRLDHGDASLSHTPTRKAVMVDFSASEFSRLRLQLNRDDSSMESANQLYLQYIMSLGAHGAHQY